MYHNVISRTRINIFIPRAKPTLTYCIVVSISIFFLVLLATMLTQVIAECQKPNIILIIADDMVSSS